VIIVLESHNFSIEKEGLLKIVLFLGLTLIISIIFSGVVNAQVISVTPSNTIKSAISTAHSGDTLNLSCGTYKEHDIMVNKNLTIIGPRITGNESPKAVIDAQKLGKGFLIQKGVNLNLQYLTIQNANTTKSTSNPYGGGVFNSGTLNVKNCIIQKNTATLEGGGIYNNHGTLNMINSILNQNTATSGYGGAAIYNYGGNVTLNGCNLWGNTAKAGHGGGINNGYGAILILINSRVHNNVAYDHGGGIDIYRTGTKTSLINSSVYNNTVVGHGGGIYNCGGNLTLNNSSVCGNIAKSGPGGGIANCYGGTLALINSQVYNNVAKTHGGGIDNYYDTIGTDVTLTNSRVYSNTANSHGGGIYNYGGRVTLNGSSVYNNIAKTGHAGGIANCYGGTLTLVNSQVYNNVAYDHGGGIDIYRTGTKTSLINSNVYHNTANGHGGGIYNYGGNLTLKGSSVCGNIAKSGPGGGIANCYGTLTVTFCRILGNSANRGIDICNYNGKVNALLNWWGSNSGPAKGKIAGTTNPNTWLVLKVSSNVSNTLSSIITANLIYDNRGVYHNPTNGHVLNGIKLTFTTTLGSISSPAAMLNGIAKSTLKSGSGTAIVSVKLDNQTVKTSVKIN